MQLSVPLANKVSLFFTEGDHGYAPVLADAKDGGGELFFVTYAITLKGDSMLKILQDGIPGVARIEFITCIPSFHHRSWNGKWRENAKAEIKEYLSVLHPDKLHASVSVAIITGSHAKLAVSSRIAYVGSANFTDASAAKKELGVIIRDAEAVRRLPEAFKEAFGADIYHYNPSASNLLSILGEIAEAEGEATALSRQIESYKDPETDQFTLMVGDVRKIQECASRMSRLLGWLIELFSGEPLAEGRIDTPTALEPGALQAHFETIESDQVETFFSFSPEKYVNDRVQDLTAAEPEALDAASEMANQDAAERLEELFDAAWSSLEPIFLQFSSIAEALQAVCKAIKDDVKSLRYLQE